MRHGGFYPDLKLRLFRRRVVASKIVAVHEDVQLAARLSERTTPQSTYNWAKRIDIIHHSYPTLSDYIEHMNRYSSLGAEMVVAERQRQGSLQRHQHRAAPVGDIHLQLFFSPRLSRRTRRSVVASLPRGLRIVEIREGLGTQPE